MNLMKPKLWQCAGSRWNNQTCAKCQLALRKKAAGKDSNFNEFEGIGTAKRNKHIHWKKYPTLRILYVGIEPGSSGGFYSDALSKRVDSSHFGQQLLSFMVFLCEKTLTLQLSFSEEKKQGKPTKKQGFSLCGTPQIFGSERKTHTHTQKHG